MEWVIVLVIALLIVPIGYAAYRKYRCQRPAAKAAGLSLTHSHEVEHGSL